MARRKASAATPGEAAPRPDIVPGAPHPAAAARLIGQGAALRRVEAALASGRMPHGWLLAGPEGIGKATLAYRIARAAIAGDGALEPPPDCPVMARIRAGGEARLRVLRRGVNDKTGTLRTEILVDDMRAVKRFLEQSMPDGGWRAVIVDAADEMNRSSANALLKFLEEPPARTLLVLVAHRPGGLLATIRSRCRRLDLAPLGAADLADALAGAGHALAPAEAEALAVLAGGSPGRAVRLIEGEGLALYAGLVAAVGGAGLDRARVLELAETGSGEAGRTRARLIVELAAILLARLARAGVAGVPATEAAPQERALLQHAGGHGALWAEAAARIPARARQALAVNLDPGQVILDMLLSIDAARGGPR